jgi:N-sulfoglucosamine sulfohydrolase
VSTDRPNILLITADDMNWDAVGVFGCVVAGTTPNLDRLAAEGMRFQHAHVTIAVCQPSRSAMMTGRYPHRSGGEGFYHLREPGVPILPELLRAAGYAVGILGKVSHSTPYAGFQWDMTYDMNDLGHGRNPALYRDYAAEFIAGAKTARRPFFLMANSHDPHRPFYGNDKQEWYEAGEVPAAVPPSRAFIPDEVTTPGFLADLPEVRLEISEYYSSVRRSDDTVGALLEVLRDSGLERNTLVIFLSDNGMAFPFAKTNCYLQSTRTPWIARWPEVVDPGTCDTTHFISGIDILPTVLEATGIEPPDGIDGSSFLPLLRGERQAGREYVYTQFHQNAGRWNYPMRCVQDARFGYIFNPWSNGERIFRNESQAGRTMAAMQAAAKGNADLAARVELFLYRVPEELYDFEHDPDALHNLVDDPRHADDLDRLRGELESWMERHSDPALAAFRQRQSEQARETYTQSMANTIGGRA